MSDLFISYSRLDQERVEKLAQALERAGLSVWWDRRIKSGESFDRVIEQAIAEAKAVIVAWSRHSTDSSWVRAEAGFALEKSKLVPVRLDDASPPLRFLHVHTIDLSAWDGRTISGECAKLIADLKEIVGAAGTPGATASAAEAIGARLEPAGQREAAKLPPPARNRTIALAALAAGVLLAGAIGFLVLRGGKSELPAKEAAAPPANVPAATAAKLGAPNEEQKMASAPSASAPGALPSREPAAQPAAASAPPAIAPESAPAPSGTPPPSAPAGTVVAVNPAADHQIEIAFWESIKDSKNAAELEAYLQKYPHGDFAAIAESRLAALKEARAAQAAATQVATAPPPALQSGPALDVLDKEMVASRAAPLREAPEIRAKQVGRLKEGESVHVAGKVKGEEWYAVEPKGQALAYVAVAALEDAAAYQAQKEREQQAKAAEAAQRAAAATPAPAPAAAQGTELAKLPQAAEPGKAPAGTIRYVGHLACEKIPGLTNNTVLAEITILANGTKLDFSRPVYSFDGKQAVATESGTGTLAPDGTVKLEGQMQGSIGRFDSSYQGTLKGDQIELKGVENIPMGGKLFTRDCKASLARQ